VIVLILLLGVVMQPSASLDKPAGPIVVKAYPSEDSEPVRRIMSWCFPSWSDCAPRPLADGYDVGQNGFGGAMNAGGARHQARDRRAVCAGGDHCGR
jgi:hypothetical protein